MKKGKASKALGAKRAESELHSAKGKAARAPRLREGHPFAQRERPRKQPALVEVAAPSPLTDAQLAELAGGENGLDLRKLPPELRPEPSSGQSAAYKALPMEAMSKHQTMIVRYLQGHAKVGGGYLTVAELADATKLTKLQTRNALRRLVSGHWAKAKRPALYLAHPKEGAK